MADVITMVEAVLAAIAVVGGDRYVVNKRRNGRSPGTTEDTAAVRQAEIKTLISDNFLEVRRRLDLLDKDLLDVHARNHTLSNKMTAVETKLELIIEGRLGPRAAGN